MDNNYENVYRSSEIIDKIVGSKKDLENVNMTEIIEYLIDIGGVFEELKLANKMDNNTKVLVEMMRGLLNDKSEYINDFISAFGIKDVWDEFVIEILSGNFNFYSLDSVIKMQDNLCGEMEVLNYIYDKRRKDSCDVYNSQREYEEIKRDIDSIHNKKMGLLVSVNLIARKFRKEYAERDIDKRVYDQTMFSSLEDEKDYIEKSTKRFSLIDCFTKHKNSNALILLESDSEYAIEPVNIHMSAAVKLYKTLHRDNNNINIELELVSGNEQGNIMIRVLNREGLKAVLPWFPKKITDYQLDRLESYFDDLKVVVAMINDDEKDMFKEGMDAIEKEIKKVKLERDNTKLPFAV